MKILVVVSAMLTALSLQVSAESCPNLTGSYMNCTATAFAQIFPVSIQISQYGKTYQIYETYSDGTSSNTAVIADGPPVTVATNDPQVGKLVTITQTNCGNNQLVTKVKNIQTGLITYSMTVLNTTPQGLALRLWLDDMTPNISPSSTPDAILSCPLQSQGSY